MTEPIIRKLKKDDLQNGFLTTLDSLRQTSNIEAKKAEEIFEKINSTPEYIIAVAELDGKIIGATTLLIEQKY
jgi:glucosamine-phosphate N-acetyltransferase